MMPNSNWPSKLGLVLIFTVILLTACSKKTAKFVGQYDLRIEGMRNVTEGRMEIAGEDGDYFGKLVILGKS